MKPIAGIVAPVTSEAEVINRWDMATGKEERAEKSLAESRLEKGRILVEARKMYPRTGNDGGWSKLLARLRVAPRTALRYMELAGYVAASDIVSEAIPTYAAAGIVKRAERRTSDEVASDDGPVELVVQAPRVRAEPEPMPEREREELVSRLAREEEERRQSALAPLRMEARETASAKALTAFESGIEALNKMHSEGVHITDCTSSPSDFERVKARALTLLRMVREELARIGIEADAQPPQPSAKRQLTLVTGD